MRPSVDSWVGRRLMGDGLFTGDPLVGFSRRALMVPTLTSVGRTVGASNGHPRLEDGRVLEDVRTVVWCTGFRPDFRWIQLPVFGPEGYPDHRRGIVAAAPGLGFVGLRYQVPGSAHRCSAVCARMPSTLSDSWPRPTRMQARVGGATPQHEGPVKAILHTQYGAPDLLQLKEVDKPAPKDDDAPDRHTREHGVDCGLQHAQFHVRDQIHAPLRQTHIWYRKALESTCPRHRVGRRVERAGKDVKRFKKGDWI